MGRISWSAVARPVLTSVVHQSPGCISHSPAWKLKRDFLSELYPVGWFVSVRVSHFSRQRGWHKFPPIRRGFSDEPATSVRAGGCRAAFVAGRGNARNPRSAGTIYLLTLLSLLSLLRLSSPVTCFFHIFPLSPTSLVNFNQIPRKRDLICISRLTSALTCLIGAFFYVCDTPRHMGWNIGRDGRVSAAAILRRKAKSLSISQHLSLLYCDEEKFAQRQTKR